MKILTPLLFISVLVFSASASSAAPFSDRYDDAIQRSVYRYWPDFPFWRAWKAQIYQESRLDPAAVSPAGARGLAQFMPATWRQTAREMRYGAKASPHTAKLAIPAGAYYMAKLRRGWSAPRPQTDRHQLAAASYNAGFGNILQAQKRCGGPNLYDDIIRCLPAVTGRHSEETMTYVERIWKWWAMMEAGL